jgi:hypothetical protein
MATLPRFALVLASVLAFRPTLDARGMMEVPVTLVVEGTSQPDPQALLEARQQASMIYDAIGVSLVWTNEFGQREDADPVRFVAVVLSDARTEQFLRRVELPPSVLGVAPYETGRVYLFWDRIVRRARDNNVLPQIVMARVLAHEIGHHLLPLQGHSDSGIMRPSLDYRAGDPPAFTAVQAASIKQFLSDAYPGD